jgi:hypothetical protein
MPILLADSVDRSALIEFMKEDGIQTSIHYPAIQSFTAYKDSVGPTPKSQHGSEHELTLPLYPTMPAHEVDLVCDSLEKNLPVHRKFEASQISCFSQERMSFGDSLLLLLYSQLRNGMDSLYS